MNEYIMKGLQKKEMFKNKIYITCLSVIKPFFYLMVLAMQKEVQRNEVVVMSRRFHVEDEAVDAVLDERPQGPTQQKKEWEHVLMDRDGELCKEMHPC